MRSIEFGENLRKIRKSKNMTKSEVSMALGIPVTAYTEYENGEIPPNDIILSLEKLFKVSKRVILAVNDTTYETIFSSQEEKMPKIIISDGGVSWEVQQERQHEKAVRMIEAMRTGTAKSRKASDLNDDEKLLINYFRNLSNADKMAFLKEILPGLGENKD